LDLLGVTEMSVEVSAREVKLGAYHQTILAWYRPFRPGSLTSPISIIMTWWPPQKFLHTPQSGAPQKCFQSGPALAKAGPDYKGLHDPSAQSKPKWAAAHHT